MTSLHPKLDAVSTHPPASTLRLALGPYDTLLPCLCLQIRGGAAAALGSCSKSPVPAATPEEAEPPVRTEAWVGDWTGAD